MSNKETVVCKTIGLWSIEYRTRNNHGGFKVWILHNGREIMSLDERGFRQRDGGRIMVPESVKEEANAYWEKAAKGELATTN